MQKGYIMSELDLRTALAQHDDEHLVAQLMPILDA
jgi:hypothetical protein